MLRHTNPRKKKFNFNSRRGYRFWQRWSYFLAKHRITATVSYAKHHHNRQHHHDLACIVNEDDHDADDLDANDSSVDELQWWHVNQWRTRNQSTISLRINQYRRQFTNWRSRIHVVTLFRNIWEKHRLRNAKINQTVQEVERSTLLSIFCQRISFTVN